MDQQFPIQAREDLLELAADPVRKARQARRRYDKAATIYRILHYFLLGSILLCSIATVVILIITHLPKDVPFILTVLDLLAIGAVGLIKPSQRSAIYHATAESIAEELTDCLYEQGLYKGSQHFYPPNSPLRICRVDVAPEV
jgi:pilus assembly protein TadC